MYLVPPTLIGAVTADVSATISVAKITVAMEMEALLSPSCNPLLHQVWGSDMPLKATALKIWVSNRSSTNGGIGRSNGGIKLTPSTPMKPFQRIRGGG